MNVAINAKNRSKGKPALKAAAAGLLRYVGVDCVNGHGGLRRVSDRKCVVCDRNKKHADKARRAEMERARYASRSQRLPQWARSPVQRKAIRAVYRQAQLASDLTGVPHEVDHVYPLRGKRVSGLHVVENLRVIPAVVNLAKSNRDPLEFILS